MRRKGEKGSSAPVCLPSSDHDGVAVRHFAQNAQCHSTTLLRVARRGRGSAEPEDLGTDVRGEQSQSLPFLACRLNLKILQPTRQGCWRGRRRRRTPIRIQLDATRVTIAAVSIRSRRTLTPGIPTRASAREVGSPRAAIARRSVSTRRMQEKERTHLRHRGTPARTSVELQDRLRISSTASFLRP